MKPKDHDEIADRLLEGLTPPGPLPELRSRILGEARAAAEGRPAADRWTRIWESAWLRAAWVASVIALIAGHVAVTPRESSEPMITAELYVDEAMADFLRPVRIEETASPHLGRASEAGHPIVEQDDGDNEP